MFKLTVEQINEYKTQGYTILRGLFSQAEIQKVKESFELLWDVSRTLHFETKEVNGAQFVFDKEALNRIVWCGAVEKYLLDVAKDSRITIPVSQLLGSTKLNQIINQAHFKMPGEKIDFKWHQDSEHRRYGTEMWKDVNGEGSFVQTLMAVDSMSSENGPLLVIPESHKLGHLDLKNNIDQLERVKEMNKIELVMNPGDLVLFGPYVVHCSQVNLSKTPRRVLINGYAYPGANSRLYPGAGLGQEIDI